MCKLLYISLLGQTIRQMWSLLIAQLLVRLRCKMGLGHACHADLDTKRFCPSDQNTMTTTAPEGILHRAAKAQQND